MNASIRGNATSGLVVLVPLFVTMLALRWLYNRVAGIPLVGDLAPQLPVIGVVAPSLSEVLFTLVVLAGLVFAIGYLMRTALGVVVAERIDAYANRVPGFRMVYNASQVAVETAVSDNVELRQPAKVELWDGTRLTAFRTGKRAPDGRSIVFVPTSPNVTSGFVVEVDEADLIDQDESLEESLTRVISAGFGERTERTREEIQDISTPEELEELGRERRERDRESGDGESESSADERDVAAETEVSIEATDAGESTSQEQSIEGDGRS